MPLHLFLSNDSDLDANTVLHKPGVQNYQIGSLDHLMTALSNRKAARHIFVANDAFMNEYMTKHTNQRFDAMEMWMHYKNGCPNTTRAMLTIEKSDKPILVRVHDAEQPEVRDILQKYLHSIFGQNYRITYPQFFIDGGKPLGGADELGQSVHRLTPSNKFTGSVVPGPPPIGPPPGPPPIGPPPGPPPIGPPPGPPPIGPGAGALSPDDERRLNTQKRVAQERMNKISLIVGEAQKNAPLAIPIKERIVQMMKKALKEKATDDEIRGELTNFRTKMELQAKEAKDIFPRMLELYRKADDLNDEIQAWTTPLQTKGAIARLRDLDEEADRLDTYLAAKLTTLTEGEDKLKEYIDSLPTPEEAAAAEREAAAAVKTKKTKKSGKKSNR